MPSAGTLLLVDDDRTMVALLEAQLVKEGFHVISAHNGMEALKLAQLHAERLDAILLDRVMPGMDGLSVVHHLKQNPQLGQIPVVMVTGSGSPEQIREGIDAGVFYYLTKPVQESVLRSVVAAALRERSQFRLLNEHQLRQHTGFTLIDTARFYCRTIEEAESLAGFVANSFPDPQRTVTGLSELLTNAVEHGNLEVGYELKTGLIENGTWRSEMARRAGLPQYQHRRVELLLQLKTDGVYVQITDEGNGFDWKSYLMIDPSRTQDNHGRGIAQARVQSFDQLKYNTKGNQVLAVVFHGKEQTQVLEW